MVAKWIAISIIVGLLAAMLPVAIVALWTINKIFVSAVLLFALIVGIVALVAVAIDKEIQIKKLQEEVKEND